MEPEELQGFAAAALEAPLMVRRAEHPFDGDAVLVGRVVVVRPMTCPVRELVALAHEAAHWALRLVRHSHGDVWLVALLSLDTDG